MGDDITIGVTTITNDIEVTAQPNDQIIDIGVTDNTDNVTINVTPSIIEINIIKGSGGGSGAVSSVNGQIGDVVLTKSDIGLSNVDNTSDLNKPISTATQTALDLKVPYTGATGNVTLGEFGLTGGYYKFDTTPTSIPTTLGTLSWDSFYRTLSLIDGIGDTNLQIGQEERVLVHNNTGVSITDGQVVYVTGSTGELPTIALANANSEATSSKTIGVATEVIPNGSAGFIITTGVIHNLNTLAFNEGDILWLSTTSGAFTNVAPISPNHLVLIGYVIKKAGGNGSILVKIQNTQELDECSDVLLTTLTNNDVLTYESSTSLWKNKSISTVLGYTPASSAITISTTAPLSGGGDLSTNRTLSISQATTSTNGYLSSTDWNTFNGKQASLSGTGIVKSTAGTISYLTDNSTNWNTAYTSRISSLTVTGSSGAATLVSNVLNIPTYTLSGLGGQASSTNLTSLSGLTFASTSFVKMTATGTFALDTTAYTSNLGTVTSVAAIILGTTGTDLSSTVATVTTTPVITLNVPTASATNRGALSSADWSTFNSKQNALTNPITGTGTINTIPKFTASGTLGNSLMTSDSATMLITSTSDAVPLTVKSTLGATSTIGFQGTTSANGFNTRLGATADDMVFFTSNTERLRVLSGGNILIGTTTDIDGVTKLQVNGYVIATGYKVPSGTSAQYLMADGSVSSGGSGGVGTTNLSYTASSTNGIVVSDTGTDATIPLANGTNAGLLSPSGFTDLSNAVLTSGNQSISGQKGFSSAGTAYSVSIITNDGTAGLYVGNSLGNYGIYGDNTSTGIGAYISNSSTGQALVLNNTTAGTGMPFSVRKNSVDALTISDNGSIDILGTNADITMKGITNEPATPSSDNITVYAKKIGGKMVLKTKDEYGVDFSLQNSFWDNNITYWSNTSATAGIWEGTIGAGAGTFTQALPTTTSIYTSIKRARYANVVTTTNQVLGQRNTEAMFFRGGLAGIGGFFFYARFGFDVWTNGSRLFAGFHSGTTVISADPSALNNTMGFCVDAADNGLISFLTRGTAATKASTGFTITTGKGYDVYMYAAPNGSTIYWKIEDLNAGTEASGSATLNLPTNTTMLTAGVLASNGALTTVTATQLGINKIYIETDY